MRFQTAKYTPFKGLNATGLKAENTRWGICTASSHPAVLTGISRGPTLRRGGLLEHRYVHLIVERGWDVVIPLSGVARLLHRQDPDYGLWAPQARSLASALGVRPSSDLPGVLAVLRDGSCWYAGDAVLGSGAEANYLTVPAWALEGKTPWCRGILLRKGGWSFVTEAASLGGLHG